VAYTEIAERSGVAVGTVKSRIHRGHAKLAAALGDARSRSVTGAGAAPPDLAADAPTGEPSPPTRPPTS
jgi:RNA polymerase sigma-70 factor, ECF subfamily